MNQRVLELEHGSTVSLELIRLLNLERGKSTLTTKLKAELTKIVDGPERERILSDYVELKEKLGGKGASELAARLIVKNV